MHIVYTNPALDEAGTDENTESLVAGDPESLFFDFYEDLEQESLVLPGDPIAKKTVANMGLLMRNIIRTEKNTNLPAGEWMKTYATQLGTIGNDLVTTRQELAKMQVSANEDIIKEAEARLQEEQNIILNLFSYYSANIAESHVKAAVLEKLHAIKSAAYILRKHSFASVVAVGLAFKMELDLMRLLGMDNTIIQSMAREYYEYFSNCLNPGVPGSIASSLKAAENTMQVLERDFTAGDKGRMDKGFGYIVMERKLMRLPFGNARMQTFTTYARLWKNYIIDGSLAGGFTGRLGDKTHKDQLRTSKPADCLANEAAAASAANQYLQTAILLKYNNASKVYAGMSADRETLAKTIADATDVRDFSSIMAS